MEEVDCERMEEKDVLHTADELTDFVELYNGKRMNGWMNEFALKQVFFSSVCIHVFSSTD